MKICVVIGLMASLSTCSGYNIDSCDNNNQLQVDETRDTVLTCSGITHDIMLWSVHHAGGGATQLVTCTWSNRQCTVQNTYYTVTRDESSVSRLTVKRDLRNRIAGKVVCAGWTNGNVVNASSCDVRVVYTDYSVVNCTTSVSTTRNWTVSGSCIVDKIFASDGRYSCQWSYEPTPGSKQFITGAISQTSFTAGGQDYQRTECFFSGQPLPTADGLYVFTLRIDPRHKPGDAHSGKSLNISSPKGPPVLLSDCPDSIIEGEDANCTCKVSASDPPAVVSWSTVSQAVSHRSTLSLKSLNGQTYTCSQYWGGLSTEHRKTAVYTVNVRPSSSRTPEVTTKPVTTTTLEEGRNSSDRDNSSNDNSDDCRAAMVGGITGGVAIVIIVALVIVIVILCKNRCDPLYAKPRLSGRMEEVHTYTELGHFQQTTPPAPATTQNTNSTTERSVHKDRSAGTAQSSSAEPHYENTTAGRLQTSSVGQYENTDGNVQQPPADGDYEIPDRHR